MARPLWSSPHYRAPWVGGGDWWGTAFSFRQLLLELSERAAALWAGGEPTSCFITEASNQGEDPHGGLELSKGESG